jgi:hypothetical protein
MTARWLLRSCWLVAAFLPTLDKMEGDFAMEVDWIKAYSD